MKKFILKIVVFLAVLICCFPTTVRAANEAEVGGVEYATLQEALDAANDGDTVNLLSHVTTSESIKVTKAVVLDGKSYSITYTGAFSSTSTAISVYSPNVTLKDFTVIAETSRFGIYCYDGGTLNFRNVKIFGGALPNVPAFALIFSNTASNAVVDITGCNIEGNYGITIWGQNMTFNIDNTIINSVESSLDEDYGAVVLSNSGNFSAENTVVNITNSTISAKKEDGSTPSRAVVNGTETGVVNISSSTVTGATINAVAFVVGGYREYYYESLQEAIDYASPRNLIVRVIRDINTSGSILINGKTTINGNGYTLTSLADEAIVIDTTDEVKINNYKIIGKSGHFGIYVENQESLIKLDEVTITVDNGCAIYVAKNVLSGATIYIENSNLSALSPIAVWANFSGIQITDTILTGVSEQPNSGTDYGVFDIKASKVNIIVYGGTISATTQAVNEQLAVVYVHSGYEDVAFSTTVETVIQLAGTAAIVNIDPADTPTIGVGKQYKQQLNNEGYGVTPPNADDIVFIDYSIAVFEVEYVAEGTTVAVIGVQNGENVTDPPAVPPKSGYTGAWDHDGTNITADTTITAVYTKTPVPETGDNNLEIWTKIMFISGLGVLLTAVYGKKKRLI